MAASDREFRLTFVGLESDFIGPSEYKSAALAEYYATLCKRHDFADFEQHGKEGALAATKGQRMLILGPGSSLSLEERGEIGFDLIRANFADIVGITRDQFKVRRFYNPNIEFRALMPVRDESGALHALNAKGTVGISEEALSVLEDAEMLTIGLTVESALGEHNDHLHIEIRPSAADPSMLYISTAILSHTDFDEPGVLEQLMDEAFTYFRDKVIGFAEALLKE